MGNFDITLCLKSILVTLNQVINVTTFATPEVANDILDSHKGGKALRDAFAEQRLLSSETKFYALMTKSKLTTFATLKKRATTKVTGQKTQNIAKTGIFSVD